VDKPIPFEVVLTTIIILITISFLIYLWLKSLVVKDSDDNIKRSFDIKQGRVKRD